MPLPFKPELIIFDLDGTLADTIADIASSVNRTLAHFGYPPHAIESYKLMVGEGFRILIQKALPKDLAGEDALIQSALDWALKDYSAHTLVQTSLFKGVPQLLRKLEERGFTLAILSNKPDRMTKSMIEALCGDIHFIAVWGNTEERPRKPDPAPALQIAALAGARPEKSLFVGDSATDMLTAKSAGMTAIGALYGYRSRKELEGAGAEHLIDAPLELLRLVDAAESSSQ